MLIQLWPRGMKFHPSQSAEVGTCHLHGTGFGAENNIGERYYGLFLHSFREPLRTVPARKTEMLLDEAAMLNLDCNGDVGDARIIRHLPRSDAHGAWNRAKRKTNICRKAGGTRSPKPLETKDPDTGHGARGVGVSLVSSDLALVQCFLTIPLCVPFGVGILCHCMYVTVCNLLGLLLCIYFT